MITFTISLLALVVGYILYGRFVERVFAPDGRVTPAVAKADGVDYVPMPSWRVFMIQFLNIAGTGPIFGAIMGAKFGPSAYLWIVLGCIFAGAVHDYLSGMLSMRNDGVGLPGLIGKYLGTTTKNVAMVFTVAMLIMVGAVFVFSPAEILHGFGGSAAMWIVIIFAYYVVATMMPIDKIIGKIYPLFAFSLLFMAVSLMIVLFVKWPSIPEVWHGLGNMAFKADSSWVDDIFPCMFITIACGAISGFHATQSPLMARCLKSERLGKPIFYGAMITEGIVALVWAAVASYFFYGRTAPGYELIAGADKAFHTSAPAVVNLVCNDWLGVIGGILAMLGVVAAPITSGDTAFRSARLIVADFVGMEQKKIAHRLTISVPLFVSAIAMLLWQIDNPDGFNVVWQYFGWGNQTLAVFTLWTLTVYLAIERKPYIITLVPALLMTTVSITFLLVSKQALHLSPVLGYSLGAATPVLAAALFFMWKSKQKNKNI